MNNPLSVIVPVFNEERYIKQCIESILAQNYSSLEIILIDDGSTDGSATICDNYAKSYGNIRSYHFDNSGITSARLRGVERARGEYVTFVDADDSVEMNYYSSVFMNYCNQDIIMVGESGGDDEKGYRKRNTYLRPGDYNRTRIENELLPNMLWDSKIDEWLIEPSLCTKVFKKNLILPELQKAEHLHCVYGEDTVIVYPSIMRANSIKVLEDSFYNYRLRDSDDIASYILDDLFFEKLMNIYNYLTCRFEEIGYLNIMKPQIDNFMISSVNRKKKQYQIKNKYSKKNYFYTFSSLFPFDLIQPNSRVVLYGAGVLGKAYYHQCEEFNICRIVKWVDKEYIQLGDGIESPEILGKCEFDYVIVAIDDKEIADEIKEDLLRLGVLEKKIIWHSIRRVK